MANKHTHTFSDNDMVVAYYRYSFASQNGASINQQRDWVQRLGGCKGLTGD